MRIADCGMGVWDLLRPKLLSRNEENLTPSRQDAKMKRGELVTAI
jgi:hypothetical protein